MSRKAWLTVDSIPSAKKTLAITLPDSEDWLAILRGALLPLTYEENWEQFGTLTPQEMADEWRSIFLEFLEEPPMIPSGLISAFAGSAAPAGWLLADGSAVGRTVYPALFAVIGTTYGPGDGSTTFNLPNLKGKIPAGLDAGQAEFDNLGESGGAKTHTLTTAEMPSHTHTQNSHNHTQDSHNHTQNSHNHTQDSHNHTQNSHNHTQNSHNHTQNPHVHADNWFVTGVGTKWDGGGAGFTPQSNSGVTFDQTATNNAATATNQAATAINQAATATNQAATATNQVTTATNQAATATNQSSGGGDAHNNLQPYLTVNYIVKI